MTIRKQNFTNFDAGTKQTILLTKVSGDYDLHDISKLRFVMGEIIKEWEDGGNIDEIEIIDESNMLVKLQTSDTVGWEKQVLPYEVIGWSSIDPAGAHKLAEGNIEWIKSIGIWEE